MRFKLATLAFTFAASALTLVTAPAFGDSLTLTGVGANSNDSGTYVYPYLFTVTEGTKTATNVALSCLNYNREITFNESWAVSVVGIPLGTGSLDGLPDVDFREDAWLMTQYDTNPSDPNAAQTNDDVQFAIWSIMDPGQFTANGVTPPAGFNANAKSLAAKAVTQAATLPTSFYANDVVFIPVNPDPTHTNWGGNGEPQIFLATVNPIPTPEPSSLMLFATGLSGAGLLLQRKSRAASASAR